jgi:hypothetical protein
MWGLCRLVFVSPNIAAPSYGHLHQARRQHPAERVGTLKLDTMTKKLFQTVKRHLFQHLLHAGQRLRLVQGH